MMGILSDRLSSGGGELSLIAGGTKVSEIVARSLAGESLAGRGGVFSPADLVAALAGDCAWGREFAWPGACAGETAAARSPPCAG